MKKYLYANGTSITQGGGFEEYQYRTDVRDAYASANIKIPEKQVECSYPYFIAKKLGLELINVAKSGSGAHRSLRTTFDWINKNPDKLNETIFLIEFQAGPRLDFYINEYHDYFVLNASVNEKDEIQWTVVSEWYVQSWSDIDELNQRYKERIETYLYNFLDFEENMKTDIMYANLLVSYLDSLNLTYIFSDSIGINELFKNNSINLSLNGHDVWGYAHTNKLIISDEVNHHDNHIGYKGNQLIGEIIADHINQHIIH